MSNVLCNSASFILNALGIHYTTEFADTYTCLMDNHATASMNLAVLKNHLSEEELSNLYFNLIISWLINDEPINGFIVGSYASGDFIPYLLQSPFKYDRQKYCYNYNSMQPSPENMILLAGDEIYTEIAEQVKDAIEGNYKELVSKLTLDSSVRTLSIFIHNYKDLRLVLELYAKNTTKLKGGQ